MVKYSVFIRTTRSILVGVLSTGSPALSLKEAPVAFFCGPSQIMEKGRDQNAIFRSQLVARRCLKDALKKKRS